jgi:signal transduction histidine kinase
LASSASSDTDVREALAAITEAAQSQARLVDDLLDASRALGNTLRMERERLNFADVTLRGCEAVRPSAEAKGVQLAIDVPVDPVWVDGDRLRLQQVVWNLVGNAVKFTPAGGRVEVRLQRDLEDGDGTGNDGGGDAGTGGDQAGRWLILTVRDTGAGIDQADLPHVFEPFFQAQGTERNRAGGVGLGLAIVKQLAERHGGRVEVSSPGPGAGTTFTVRLPPAGAAEGTPAHPATAVGAGE